MYVNCSQAQFAVPLNYSHADGHNCFILLDNGFSNYIHRMTIKNISFPVVLSKYHKVFIIRMILEKLYRSKS